MKTGLQGPGSNEPHSCDNCVLWWYLSMWSLWVAHWHILAPCIWPMKPSSQVRVSRLQPSCLPPSLLPSFPPSLLPSFPPSLRRLDRPGKTRPDKMSDRMPMKMSEYMSEYMSDRMSDRMSENMWDKIQMVCQNVCHIRCQTHVRIYATVGITLRKHVFTPYFIHLTQLH